MSNCYRLLTIIIAVAIPVLVQAHDPGETDTLRFEASPIGIGQSGPMVISIRNDSAVVSWDAYLLFTGSDSSLLSYDSVRYVGRLAEPSVEPMRFATPAFADGLSPDTLTIACIMGIGQALPPGDGPVMELFFTGLKSGAVTVDTIPGGIDFTHPGHHPPDRDSDYVPYFVPSGLDVLQPDRPPNLEVPVALPVVATTRDRVAFDLEASSPSDRPVQVVLRSFFDADDSVRMPYSAPSVNTVGGYHFEWNPNPRDIGIWQATFVATDSAGLATAIAIEIQVVAGQNYLLPLVRIETGDVLPGAGLAHGNLDNDPYPELLVSTYPTGDGTSFGSYDILDDGRLDAISTISDGHYPLGMRVAYLNSDPHLDAVACSFDHLRLFVGRGDGSFVINDDQPELMAGARSAVLTDFDGDARLDYAVTGHDYLQIFRQSADLSFESSILLELDDPALTVNSADFNLDGWDDLAVGTKTGLNIYINDGAGGYERGEHYEQTFGTTDIEVTGHGSDFNRDGLYDLCLATPSAGGAYSELIVYMGRGDGTFEPGLVRRVRGQISANCPGDFNGDSYPDIAFINGAEGYLAIVFGDGQGEFPNERRYRVGDVGPRQLDVVDFDLDGDLDLIVAACHPRSVINAGYFAYVNPLDPIGVSPGRLEVRASNNAKLELHSPSGGRLNRVVNSMASGEMHRLRLDTNAVIDEIAISSTVEAGRYDLLVGSRPNLGSGEVFSLSYQVDDRPFRLVADQSPDPDGFRFPIYPAGSSPVSPIQGDFIQTAMPTFIWPSTGVDRFELATGPGFENILESATVGSGVYTLTVVLPNTDSVTYYWRVRPESGSESVPIYAFNVVRAPTDVDDLDTPDNLPDSCRLAQNYPNPFNPETTIEFYLPNTAPVTVTIHNVLGQLIKTLLQTSLPPGTHTVDWDATDLQDRPVASGIYFYRMEVGDFSSTRKMVLVR